jgi:hypothetical protein
MRSRLDAPAYGSAADRSLRSVAGPRAGDARMYRIECVDLGPKSVVLRRLRRRWRHGASGHTCPPAVWRMVDATVSYGRRWTFRMLLSHSRHVFVPTPIRMDQQTWTQAHAEVFAVFDSA